MDQGKLELINCHSQTFSNNPNEKFLLMILCSQAKLENDNRGINVKRGHRNKCMIGIRPGPAPIGYINILKANRISSVQFDKERAPIVKEMFERVGYEGHSGRMIRRWLRSINFKTPRGCEMSLGRVFATLKNPFYYGEFKFGGKWYKGSYQPLVSRKLFDKVQVQLETYPKRWNKQVFPFKRICTCANCGSGVTAEIRYRVLRSTKVNTHIYYHCCKSKDMDCREPYITEQELISQLISFLPQMKLDKRYLLRELNDEIKRVSNMKKLIEDDDYNGKELTPHKGNEKIKTTDKMIKNYLLHILQFGTPQERGRILRGIKSRFELSNRRLIISN
jgi:hypothetical protein